jgi:hypothetical protein
VNSSVDIAMDCGLEARDWIPDKGKGSRPTMGPIQPPIQWVVESLSSAVKRQGRKTDHSSPTSVVVGNCGAIPLLPHASSCSSAKLIKYLSNYYFD